MAKLWQTKLPDGLDAAAEQRITELGLTRYQYLQELVMKDLSVIPPIPKKPPPLPKKAPALPRKTDIMNADRPVWEVIPRLHAWLVAGAPKDEVWGALGREARRGMAELDNRKPEWLGLDRYPELWQMLSDLLDLGRPLDTFQRGCLAAIEQDFRDSLPRLRLGPAEG